MASRVIKRSTKPNNRHLPRVLCLHGAGSSGAIFRIQTRALQKALQHHFRLIFLDAPIESTPGPGILPVFEGAGPYFRWTDTDANKAWKVIQQVLNNPDGAPFVGILGFSEGATVIADILHRLQNDDGAAAVIPRLGFCVLMAATMLHIESPPLDARIQMPTIHVHGSSDHVLEECKQLLTEFFDPTCSEVLRWEGPHEVMVQKADVRRLVDMILELSMRDHLS
ncbi:hypothetical protein sscle_14g097880 [Sclerotinia sclerotiorum 1980 UF-70]|uniref:Serine hydrolase domain-containing protein n=1 Tax=Sclerotinia sclerotiorum (strain ATCC 18683 / 1980 / Ss-1) TaxID=665079 RepID=A0A1D9QJB1_SCLS1|nr:hypothetical protein sscle_14g097880 [Sclerotinia sclerotiorum 1980 UF-70]